MIWTVVLWLGMQGQATTGGSGTVAPQVWSTESKVPLGCHPDHPGANYGYCDNGNVYASSVDTNKSYACVTLEQAALYPYVPLCEPLPAPAEHVFEIRTKRDESAPIKNEYLIGCREGFTLIQSEHVSGDVWTTEGCVRITRELWIDGKRLGTIKGLD